MRLQYLGDSRDAFKWDLLHWICTTTSFTNLVFVPLLTPDEKDSREGLISHHRFHCQGFIRPFLDSLTQEPRSLERIKALGSIDPAKTFPVQVFAPERHIEAGISRSDYWSGFDCSSFGNSVVFFDPDNGYETKTKHGSKWIRHSELKKLFERLPATSVAIVYQHRPRLRRWLDLFHDLAKEITYVRTSSAVFESDLAFVAMAANETSGNQISEALRRYAENHPVVKISQIPPA
jgi:hypothetical protein